MYCRYTKSVHVQEVLLPFQTIIPEVDDSLPRYDFPVITHDATPSTQATAVSTLRALFLESPLMR